MPRCWRRTGASLPGTELGPAATSCLHVVYTMVVCLHSITSQYITRCNYVVYCNTRMQAGANGFARDVLNRALRFAFGVHVLVIADVCETDTPPD